MKKAYSVLLIFLLFTNCTLANEGKTDCKIQEKCGYLVKSAEHTGNINKKILAYECLFKQNKKNEKDNLEVAVKLHDLYEDKFQNSLRNPKYFNKMLKYSFAAIDSGSQDPVLIEKAFFYAYRSNAWDRSSKMTKAFETLAYIDKKRSEKIRAYVEEQEEISLRQKLEDLKNTAVFDMESGRRMSLEEKKQLDYNRSKTNRSNIQMTNWSSSSSSSHSSSSSSSKSSNTNLLY